MPTTTPTTTPRGIIFRDWQIRAINEGRLSQFRVPLRRQPPEDVGRILVGDFHPTKVDRHGEEYPGEKVFGAYNEDGDWGCVCPYKPGDELAVRERGLQSGDEFMFEDDDDFDGCYPTRGGKMNLWRVVPAQSMPLDFARHWVTVKDVKVQRTTEATHRDALNEGVPYDVSKPDGSPLARFKALYDDASVWFWVVAFEPRKA